MSLLDCSSKSYSIVSLHMEGAKHSSTGSIFSQKIQKTNLMSQHQDSHLSWNLAEFHTAGCLEISTFLEFAGISIHESLLRWRSSPFNRAFFVNVLSETSLNKSLISITLGPLWRMFNPLSHLAGHSLQTLPSMLKGWSLARQCWTRPVPRKP